MERQQQCTNSITSFLSFQMIQSRAAQTDPSTNFCNSQRLPVQGIVYGLLLSSTGYMPFVTYLYSYMGGIAWCLFFPSMLLLKVILTNYAVSIETLVKPMKDLKNNQHNSTSLSISNCKTNYTSLKINNERNHRGPCIQLQFSKTHHSKRRNLCKVTHLPLSKEQGDSYLSFHVPKP